MPNHKPKYPKDWIKIRNKVLARDKWCCRFCHQRHGVVDARQPGGTVRLTVQALNGDMNDLRPSNLWAACLRCHKNYEQVARERGLR